MHSSNRRSVGLPRLLISALVGAAVLAACSDHQPVAPPEPSVPLPAVRTVQAFDCAGSIRGGVSCKAPAGGAGEASGVLIGSSGTFVTLTSSNTSYDPATEIYQFNVTVKNLLNEAIGTPDGTVADPDGIRVFFQSGPTITAGSGNISVANNDGTATFIVGDQPFFAYNEILEKGEVSSAKTWQLNMSSTVDDFTFTLLVETDVQYLLVINEFLVNPGGAITDASGEWFEIHNAGSLPVEMQGLVIADSSASGRRPYHLISSSLVVQPGGYVVLGNTTNTTNNGGVPVDYAYGSAMAFANSLDALKISRVYGTDTLTIDRTQYASAAISAQNGISRELKNPALDNSNMDGSSWGDALTSTVYGPGGRGTPKTQNATPTAPPPCVPPAMAVGEVRVLAMPSAATFCLGGGASGAEYTVVPLNASASAGAPLSLTATGIVPVSGAPSPTRIPAAGAPTLRASSLSSLRAADAFELALRRRERGELTPRISAARQEFRTRAAAARRSITQGVPAMNSLMTLNAESTGSCSASATRTGRVKVVGTHVIVVADTSNPAGGLSDADYQEIAIRFETLVWPAVTASFGAPEDIDFNGRVVVFFTRAVNALTPGGAAPVTHGFTLRRDLFFSSSCAGSNEGEMIYLEAADPAGTVNGNVRSAASVRSAAALTLGHEMAHLVNASRRLYVNFAPSFEETWLDEGLAGVAEELLFHAASGKQPRQNLAFADVTGGGAAEAAFVAYAEPNYARLRQWLLAPHASGLFQGDDDMATRGAGWAFLRYAADRKGGTESAFWSALVNATSTGMTNVQAAIGTAPDPWVLDFATAAYSDDAVAGVAAAYTQPSWNFRSFYNALDYNGDRLADGHPLAPRNPLAGVADAFTLATAGGAAYLRMGVVANGTAGVSILSGGIAPPSTVRVAVFRRK